MQCHALSQAALGQLHHQLVHQRGLEPRRQWVERLERRCYRAATGLDALRRLGWRQPPVSTLPRLRALLSLNPQDQIALKAGRDLLRHWNRTALNSLSQQLANSSSVASRANVLPVLVSCRARAKRSQQAANSFLAAEEWPQALIVVGNPRLPDWCLRYDPSGHCLQLPVSDAYDALPQKVMWLMLALSLLDKSPAVLKMDDDARPAQAQTMRHTLARLEQDPPAAAAGYPISVASGLALDRAWHLGKSSRWGNRRVFDSLACRRWMSGGVGYLLSSTGVTTLGDYALHSWGFVESMLYEDVCVSMVLEAAELPVHWLSEPHQLGLHSERSEEIVNGRWDHASLPC